MYGGTKEIFEQSPPPITVKQEAEETPVETPGEGPESNSVETPPIPETGLPEGWTMEQWAHYGKSWLDQQNDK
jgi:hypothetical protein